MRCEYCDKRLGLLKRMKGDRYCTPEHRELHYKASIESLRASLAWDAPKELDLQQAEAKKEWARVKLEKLQAQAAAPQVEPVVEPQVLPEGPPVEAVVGPQAKKASEETSLTLNIASLMEAVEKTGSNLPEAPFRHVLPSPQNQPAFSLKTYAAEPISATVQLPVSPTPPPPLRASPTLVLDVSPGESSGEVTPIGSQANWRPVPPGYPPVIASASTTLVLDSNAAELIPLRMGQPCRAEGPVPPPQAGAIEVPLRQPRLPSWRTDRRPGPEIPALFAPPPQAPACDPAWEGRPASGPALPPLAEILHPPRDVVRMVPPARHENLGALSSFPFFAAAPDIPVTPKELLVTPAATPLPVAIIPRHTLYTAPSMSPLALARASRPLAIDSTTPLRCEPSFGEVNSAWLQIAVTSQLARFAIVLPSAPIELSLTADAVFLGFSSAANIPPPVETAAAVPFFAAAPGIPVLSTELLVTPAAHLPAATSPRHTLGSEKGPTTSQTLELARASRALAVDTTTPVRYEPSFGEVNSAWLQIAVATQLPQVASVLPPAPIGLSLTADAVPLGSWSGASFPLAVETAATDIYVPPKGLLVTPAAHLQAVVTPRHALSTAKAGPASQTLALVGASRPLAIDSTTPLRGEPSFGQVNFASLQIAVADQLPRVASGLPPAPIGLSLTAEAVPLGCSSVPNFPPAVETAAAVTSALPFLLLSRPLSIAAPGLPLWSSTRPLWREACRLPAPVSEQQWTPSAAYLHPSHPSPLSLVTWSHSLSISIPARNRSNLAKPAPIGVSARQGRIHALRPGSPSLRGYRLTPLLPQPNGITWSPAAPMPAPLQPPAIKAIRPGGQGTAPPYLMGVRVQPASMPALPPTAAPFGIESGTGFMILGPSSEDPLQLTCIDVAHDTSRMAWELRAESSAVLPLFLARRHVPAIGLAPCRGHRFWWCAIPPVQTVGTVQPFSARKRLAWSVTACLPGASLAGLTERQGLTPSPAQV
jgi:hypothetical protein